MKTIKIIPEKENIGKVVSLVGEVVLVKLGGWLVGNPEKEKHLLEMA